MVRIVDAGAPQYHPLTQSVSRAWADSTETVVIPADDDNPEQTVQVAVRTAIYTVHDRPLADVKAEYKAKVDHDAATARLRYITPGAGMDMTYQEKHAQARAVIALGETAANALSESERQDQFPVLAASVGIEAQTLWACAGLVIARYEAFADIAGAIERTRLLGKKAIGDASDVAAAVAAYEAIAWTA